MWLIFCYLFVQNDDCCFETHTIGTNFSKPNTLAKYTIGQDKIRVYCPSAFDFRTVLNIFLLQVRISIFLLPKIVIISCQYLKGNKVFNIQSQICQLNGEDDYKTDVIQFFLQWKSWSSDSSLISLPIMACRFMHNFIVDCRFASLIVDVDFRQKVIVDCRQKGPKSCDLHLIRTPP